MSIKPAKTGKRIFQLCKSGSLLHSGAKWPEETQAGIINTYVVGLWVEPSIFHAAYLASSWRYNQNPFFSSLGVSRHSVFHNPNLLPTLCLVSEQAQNAFFSHLQWPIHESLKVNLIWVQTWFWKIWFWSYNYTSSKFFPRHSPLSQSFQRHFSWKERMLRQCLDLAPWVQTPSLPKSWRR